MKPEDLLDHALGRLEGPARDFAEAEFARDPALAGRADRLGLALNRLLDDGDPFGPPIGLSARTVAFVAERKSRRAILDFVPARVPFRWADVAVAAGILMAGLLTLLPAIKSARDKMSQAGCGFNLQQLYSSLTDYAERHRHYPKVCGKAPEAPVGSYARDLADVDPELNPRSLHCPCRGESSADAPRPDLGHIAYAYHIGHRHRDSDQVMPASPTTGTVIPILADEPPHDGRNILPGNSPNHGGRGQNVLCSDGSVRWLPTRQFNPLDRDIFLNDEEKLAPGVFPNDSTLVPAGFWVSSR